jgi:uncharacterized SAM-binding protein YcdF (DUF218 family)
VLFVLSKIVSALTLPSRLLPLLWIAGASIVLWRRDSRWGRGLLVAGVAGIAACAVLPVGTWLLGPLESRFPPLHAMPAQIDGIIVPGGAIDVKASAAQEMPALNERADRMTAFAALARRYSRARLVFTGGNSDLIASGPTEADVARSLFVAFGLDLRRITFEAKSRNTRENALFSKQLVHPGLHEDWLLVTSAADMPRAIGCFRVVGWPVVAFPVDYHTQEWHLGEIPGMASELRNLDWAAHEWIGLIYYRLRGWTPSLFPGPAATKKK